MSAKTLVGKPRKPRKKPRRPRGPLKTVVDQFSVAADHAPFSGSKVPRRTVARGRHHTTGPGDKSTVQRNKQLYRHPGATEFFNEDRTLKTEKPHCYDAATLLPPTPFSSLAQ